MRPPRAPLFLSRRFYRRRRLRDAARLLPVFGMFLLILPVLWAEPGQTVRATGRDAVYYFGLWALLIVFAMIFAAGLSADAGEDGDADADAGDED
jgi:hypothetical protein